MNDDRFEASRFVPFAGIGPVAAGLVLGAMVIARAGGTPWLAAVADDTPALLMAMPNSRRGSMRIWCFLEITEADGLTATAGRGVKSVVTERKTHLGPIP